MARLYGYRKTQHKKQELYIYTYFPIIRESVKLTLSATRTGEKATLTPCVSQPSPAQLLGTAFSRAGQPKTSQTQLYYIKSSVVVSRCQFVYRLNNGLPASVFITWNFPWKRSCFFLNVSFSAVNHWWRF